MFEKEKKKNDFKVFESLKKENDTVKVLLGLMLFPLIIVFGYFLVAVRLFVLYQWFVRPFVNIDINGFMLIGFSMFVSAVIGRYDLVTKEVDKMDGDGKLALPILKLLGRTVLSLVVGYFVAKAAGLPV